jgi:hypothetical protein
MKTKEQLIAAFKLEYPTLRVGNEEEGYTELSNADYEATLESWADRQIAKESAKAEAETKRAAAEAKLAALGLTADDLKALGLGGN